MKKKTGKRIRCGSPAGAIFVLGVLILVVGGSFAAYTNFLERKACRVNRNTERYNVWFELSVTDKTDG